MAGELEGRNTALRHSFPANHEKTMQKNNPVQENCMG